MKPLDIQNTSNSQIASSRTRELGSGSNLLNQLESRVNTALKHGGLDNINGTDNSADMLDKVSNQQIMEYIGRLATGAGQSHPAGMLIQNTIV
jgi:hypothetical protein